MDDRQWMVTCGLAAVFVSAFLYLPAIGGFWTFLVVIVAQGVYLGWQPVPRAQARLGGLVFGAMLALGILFLGFLFRREGPGNLWGIVALLGTAAGWAAMWIARGLRQHRDKSSF
jgi:tryptophan-rich sensory protein